MKVSQNLRIGPFDRAAGECLRRDMPLQTDTFA